MTVLTRTATGAFGILACMTLSAPDAHATTHHAHSFPPATITTQTIQTPAASQFVQGGTFDINLNFNVVGLTPSQSRQVKSAYQTAERFYEAAITGYARAPATLVSPGAGPVQISADIVPIDGRGGTLGQAGPDQVTTFHDPLGTFSVTTHGSMQFDTADIVGLLATGRFSDIVLHEMAHVLGFGTLWGQSFHSGAYSIYDVIAAPGEYIGSHALAMYQSEFGNLATFIPVETGTGLTGTDHTHWAQVSQVWAGGIHELMTGFLTIPTYFSNTSLHAFRDLGYATLNTVPVLATPVPQGAALLGGALLALNLCRGSRRRDIARAHRAA